MSFIKKALKVFQEASEVVRKTNFGKWSNVAVYFDFLYCRLVLHVSITEYLSYRFYNFSNRYRKKFLLIYHQQKLFRQINIPGFTFSKTRFKQMIPDCFAREMFLASECGEERFLEFAKKHGKIVTKPDTGSYGKDVTIFNHTDDQQTREYFSTLPADTVCEEFIWQHDRMNEINPYSVNTIRIVSLAEEDGVEIICATLRTGGKVGAVVDNLRKDGIGAQVDVATGIISTCGFDYNDGLYVKHPVTGTQFLGFNIPHWDQAVALVKKAHGQLSQCKLLGWDIAITQAGVDIVEANNRPGTLITQMVDLVPKGEKIIEAIKKAKKKKHK